MTGERTITVADAEIIQHDWEECRITINSTPFCHSELVSESEKGVQDVKNRIINSNGC